jgi:hypothetical protein
MTEVLTCEDLHFLPDFFLLFIRGLLYSESQKLKIQAYLFSFRVIDFLDFVLSYFYLVNKIEIDLSSCVQTFSEDCPFQAL